MEALEATVALPLIGAIVPDRSMRKALESAECPICFEECVRAALRACRARARPQRATLSCARGRARVHFPVAWPSAALCALHAARGRVRRYDTEAHGPAKVSCCSGHVCERCAPLVLRRGVPCPLCQAARPSWEPDVTARNALRATWPCARCVRARAGAGGGPLHGARGPAAGDDCGGTRRCGSLVKGALMEAHSRHCARAPAAAVPAAEVPAGTAGAAVAVAAGVAAAPARWRPKRSAAVARAGAAKAARVYKAE